MTERAANILQDCADILGVPLQTADAQALHQALGQAIMRQIHPRWQECRAMHRATRRVCYLSLEFLMGRAIHNNLFCLHLQAELDAALQEQGLSLALFEEVEDAALGNGGLGRLAACFLDSAATLSLPVDGYGIRYRYGLFRQSFVDGKQVESADDWTRFGDCWSERAAQDAVLVSFADQTVRAVPYDTPIIGYTDADNAPHIGTLRLWQAEPVTGFDFQTFQQQNYLQASAETIAAEDFSRCLYPNDDTRAGKLLRLKQQYFFCAASLADCLKKHKATHGSLDSLPDFLAMQLNDTHPVIAIPELIRLLLQEGYTFDAALAQATHIFSYTNHTIMAEALETWDCELMEACVPAIYSIILQISEAFLQTLYQQGLPEATIQTLRIVKDGRVHMANLALYAGHTVNGVAKLHTELLQTTVLKDWYALTPEKFQNKTNGITQRRWLGVCNPELCALLTTCLGSDAYLTDLSLLRKLAPAAEDASVLQQFLSIKQQKKEQLAAYVRKKEGILLDPQRCFDIQIKRLHEYKRQLLNAFSIVDLYFRIKDGTLQNFQPTTFLFGAKAAPGYRRAKAIIQYIHAIAERVNNDPATKDVLQVVFVQDYNVSYAEKIVPACEISEQISTAGTEASGTGNMKMMLNGAVTLGTLDGANVEIVEQAGAANNYIFGATVAELQALGTSYCSRAVFAAQPETARVVRTLIDGTFSDGGTGVFRELYFSLLDGASWHRPDQYYLIGDFLSYRETKMKALQDYADRIPFAQKQWRNLCAAGIFSADRTIRQYADECWHIQSLHG